MHRWKSQVKEFEDKAKAFICLKADAFLKVEGQCTEAMKGRTLCHRNYEAANTEQDGFALLAIIEGISIGIEDRRNTAVLATNAKDKYIKIRQGSMTFRVKNQIGCHGTGRNKLG